MKILILAPYAYIPEINMIKNTSGLAHMITNSNNIIAQKHDVQLLTQSSIVKKTYNTGNLTVMKKTLFDLIISLKWCYIKYGMIHARKEIGLLKKIKKIYYHMVGSYSEKLIKRFKPDLIIIHTIGYYSLPFILSSNRTKSNYIIYLHGLLSFNLNLGVSLYEIKLEKTFLNLAHANCIPLITVSSGMKNKIENYLGLKNNYIYVVTNSIQEINLKCLIKKKRENIALIVGSLTKNKNHQYLIEVFQNPEIISKNTKLLIIGTGDQETDLKNFVYVNDISNVTFMGKLEYSEVQSYYRRALMTIVASHEEGFGLTIIESYMNCTPVVMFKDLDAFDDTYDSAACVGILERSKPALLKAIITAIDKNWDYDLIHKHGQKFGVMHSIKKIDRILNECVESSYNPICVNELYNIDFG